MVYQAEEAYAKDPGLPVVRQAIEAVLDAAARQAVERGQRPDAIRYLERGTELWPDSPRFWSSLIRIHEDMRAWREVELVARRGMSARRVDPSLHRMLATALMMEGRDAEAADGLRRFLMVMNDAECRALLRRLEKELGTATGMAQRASSHFSVRFEGQTDDALGQALVEVLEDKYAMLSRTLGFSPDGMIAVLLYPNETFRSISTAPGWTRGYYSHFDGRIRIGTRNLAGGFVPVDLERTLTHELTHAFVAWRGRGQLPDDINEGLAQYLSGRRLGYRLAASRAVPVNGRMKVDDFYDAALSFVEYLLDRYQQSAMNELLVLLGTTDLDRAFRRAYGRTYDEARQAWMRQLSASE